jgi:hypothetical protein
MPSIRHNRKNPQKLSPTMFFHLPESSFSDRSGRASADLRTSNGGRGCFDCRGGPSENPQVVREQNSWRPILHRGACPGSLDHEGTAPHYRGRGRASFRHPVKQSKWGQPLLGIHAARLGAYGACPSRNRGIVGRRPISPFKREEVRAASKCDYPAPVGRGWRHSSSVIGAYGEDKNPALTK